MYNIFRKTQDASASSMFKDVPVNLVDQALTIWKKATQMVAQNASALENQTTVPQQMFTGQKWR